VGRQAAQEVPLLVYLHGCNQRLMTSRGHPPGGAGEEKACWSCSHEQTRPAGSSYPLADGNGSGCWNWFHPDHQTRDAGEPATLAAMTRDVMSRFSVDGARVWLSGASAGADMATILAATHPDLYAAVAPIAGCGYRSCSDADGSGAHAAMGERARVVPTLVVHGSADMVNNAAMGGTAVEQWVGTNDLADDACQRQHPPAPSSPRTTRCPGLPSRRPVRGQQPAAVPRRRPGTGELPVHRGAVRRRGRPLGGSRCSSSTGRTTPTPAATREGTFVDPVGPGPGARDARLLRGAPTR
jgi:poly(hydroxyalkanoate) depolymerase family esterase